MNCLRGKYSALIYFHKQRATPAQNNGSAIRQGHEKNIINAGVFIPRGKKISILKACAIRSQKKKVNCIITMKVKVQQAFIFFIKAPEVFSFLNQNFILVGG